MAASWGARRLSLETRALRRELGAARARLEAESAARERAEQELEVAQSRFRRLFNANLLGVAIANPDGSIHEANEAFLEMLGFARGDAPAGPLRWDTITPPEWTALDARAVEQLRVSGVARPWEKEYFRKDGSRVPVIVGVAALGDPAGQVIVGVIDLTEQRRAERSLRRRSEASGLLHEVARRLLDKPGDAGIDAALDALGRFVRVDRIQIYLRNDDETYSATRHWRGPSAPLWLPPRPKVPLSDYPWVTSQLVRGSIVRIPSVARLPGEAARARAGLTQQGILSVTFVPLQHNGAVTGWIALEALFEERDWDDDDIAVTQLAAEIMAIGQARAQAEAALRREETALSEAKEAAEAASRSKSRFLANMSHELRTPLNGVIGMVNLLAGTSLDERQQRYTEVARSSARLLLSVINDVLDFSKIEAGKLELEESDFSVAALLEEVASVLSLPADDKGLDLSCQWTPELVEPLSGDPARIRQVLVNLASNAIKFTAAGEVRMRAAIEREGGGELVIRFEISDTGIGVTKEARGRLFLPFSQGDASTTRSYGGSGLGLAICQQLVERMGGAIGVESEPGQGATFWFTVKLRPSEASAVALPKIERLRGVRVLAVDDNATNREILEQELTAAGMICATAADGAAALEALRAAAKERPFVISLLDHHMPGMDGITLATRIKGDPALASTVVVLLGSVGRPLSTAEQQSLGIAGYATKPIWRARLLNVLAAALDGGPSALPREVDRSVGAPEGAGRRVLLVEDSEINAEVAREILSAAGYTIELAENGRKAVEAALADTYDVVLMDCQLPELDGFEATRRIREGELAQARERRVPIIALTASATKEDHDRCLASGMNDFAAKPVDAARLLRLVAAYAADRAPSMPPLDLPRARLVDMPRALARVQGNAALLRRLAAQLSAIAPTALDDLSAAVAARDTEKARFVAHRFGGQAATFDAERVVADLERLRRAVTEARWGDADLLLGELRPSVDRMVRELREIAT